MAKVDKNYEFYIKADLSEYAGKWIAIVDGKVVASGDDPEHVYMSAEKSAKDKEISLAYVPRDELLILVVVG
ncbi:MAG: succinyl-CoA synthetase subunit alpha [Thermoplasmata archaeon]|nr:MAG: succinyl-CoA synthetase subunit alpha [Thermoplasmata archaeon]